MNKAFSYGPTVDIYIHMLQVFNLIQRLTFT